MRWSPGGSNPDVEDRRGVRYSGGGGGMRMPLGKLGGGGIILMIILSLVFKQDFLGVLGDGGGGGTAVNGPVESTPQEDSLKSFIEFVLGDVQSTWDNALSQQ